MLNRRVCVPRAPKQQLIWLGIMCVLVGGARMLFLEKMAQVRSSHAYSQDFYGRTSQNFSLTSLIQVTSANRDASMSGQAAGLQPFLTIAKRSTASADLKPTSCRVWGRRACRM